jgi:small subunit ribosomal protein S20
VANTRSAQKAMRQADRRTARNQAARSAVRTHFKNASVAVGSGSDDIAEQVRDAVRALDKAAQKGIIHRNAAARRKSRLMSRLHSLAVTEKPAAADKKPAAKATTTGGKRGASSSRATAERKPAARKPAARKSSRTEK